MFHTWLYNSECIAYIWWVRRWQRRVSRAKKLGVYFSTVFVRYKSLFYYVLYVRIISRMVDKRRFANNSNLYYTHVGECFLYTLHHHQYATYINKTILNKMWYIRIIIIIVYSSHSFLVTSSCTYNVSYTLSSR